MSFKTIGKLLITLCATLLLPSAFAQKAPATNWHELPEIGKIFQEAGTAGTFVLFDQSSNTLSGYNQKRANKRLTPASTFKIPNSLIAFETGVVKDTQQIFPYDGGERWLPQWKKDMTIKEAMALSNYPLYQEFAKQIGSKQMQQYLNQMHYGNQKIGSRIDNFWVRGPLAISAVEQTQVLTNISQKKPPFSSRSYALLNTIMPQEKSDKGAISFKTGWATNSTPNVGWLVGWVQSGGKTYSFAMNMEINYKNSENELPKRIEVVKQILRQLNLF